MIVLGALEELVEMFGCSRGSRKPHEHTMRYLSAFSSLPRGDNFPRPDSGTAPGEAPGTLACASLMFTYVDRV